MRVCVVRYYLDGVAQEINEALAESGQIILTELAPRFSLTTDFVVQVNNATHDTTRHDTQHSTTRPC